LGGCEWALSDKKRPFAFVFAFVLAGNPLASSATIRLLSMVIIFDLGREAGRHWAWLARTSLVGSRSWRLEEVSERVASRQFARPSGQLYFTIHLSASSASEPSEEEEADTMGPL